VITGFSHVQLIVRDVDTSAGWYARALGMEEFSRGTFAGGDYAALRSRSGGFVIGLQSARPDQAASPAAGSIEHLSFAVPGRESLLHQREALVAAGVEVGEVFEEAASWNLRLADPDGLAIELTAPKHVRAAPPA
jgi:glyoxylase I family protein